jgi:hypothetical protein
MIAFLLGAVAAAGAAGADDPMGGVAGAAGPLDQQITIIGRDEAALPLPSPWEPDPYAFPPPDMRRPVSPLSPPFMPPLGDWAGFLPQAGYTYVGCAGAPPHRTETHSV